MNVVPRSTMNTNDGTESSTISFEISLSFLSRSLAGPWCNS